MTSTAFLSPGSHHNNNGFIKSLAFMAMFCSLYGIVLLACHVGFRHYFGLPLKLQSTLEIMAIWLATCHVFFALPNRIQSWLIARKWLIPLVPISILMLPLIGWIIGTKGTVIFFAIAALGTLNLLSQSVFTHKEWRFLLILAIIYGVYFFTWANGFTTTYYSENPDISITNYYPLSAVQEVASLGTLYHDYYFHASLINMLQKWGEASTGLDGLVPFQYHIGSHIWFASLGRLTNNLALTMIPLGQLLLIFPAIHLMILWSMLCMRSRLYSDSIFYLCIALFSITAGNALSTNLATHISVTFAPALIILLASFPALVHQSKKLCKAGTNVIAPVTIICIFSLFMAICKTHVGLFYCAIGGYLLLRRWFSHRLLLSIFLPLFSLLLIILKNTFLSTQQIEIFSKEGGEYILLRLYSALQCIIEILWCYTPAIILLIISRQWRYSPHLSSKWLYQEIMWLILIISIFPMIIHPGSQVMQWFPYTAYWCLLLLCLACPYCESRYLPILHAKYQQWKASFLDKTNNTNPVGKFFILAFIFFSTINLSGNSRTIVTGISANIAQINKYIEAQPTLLEKMSEKIAATNHEKLAVFVPTTNTDFWTYGIRRSSRSFFIPSLTAIPMLMGLPPAENTKCLFDCVLMGSSFESYTTDAIAGNPSEKDICKHAQRQGIEQVLILRDIAYPKKNKLLNCK